jgi:PAS domain S-box-containing protein
VNEKKRPAPASTASALADMLRASDGILDLLPVATVITDAHGKILQYNRAAVEIWGRSPEPGQTHQEFTAGARYFDLSGNPGRSMLAEVLATGQPVRDAERIVHRMDGVRVIVSLNIDVLRNARGEVVGAINCFHDITERKRMDDALAHSQLVALEQQQRWAATYEHAAIGISEIAPDGTFLRVNEATTAITGYSREHLLNSKLFTHTHPDDIDVDRDGFLKQVSGGLDFYSMEKRFVRPDGRVIWLSVRSSPVRSAEGRLLYVVRVLQDITERKAADRRQKLLIDELNHRVKNTLATVQSLAMQSARGAPTPEAFREGFEGRLIALSKAHDQLTAHHWESAELRELLTASLAPYFDETGRRVAIRGETIVLRPRAALTLAMAFHELTTNAAKYGALSSPRGHVEIRWERVGNGRGDPPLLRIEWEEKGGPAVAEPERRGFGTRLIERGVAADLEGRTAIAFDAAGLRCTIDVPLESAIVERDVAARGDDWTI